MPAASSCSTSSPEARQSTTSARPLHWINANAETDLAAMVGLSVGGHLAYLAATEFDLPAVSIFYGG